MARRSLDAMAGPVAPGARSARALGLLALLAAGTVAGLLIAEALARLAWRAPEARPRVTGAGLPELKSAAELTRPGAQGIYNGALYHANSAGFRGREYAPEKPPDVFRIVVVGDSFTMGSGVRDEETYPSLVEDALNRRGDRRYEVLNLGLIGLHVNGVVDRLTQLGLRFNPDLIVYGCTLNDIKGSSYRSSVTTDGWLIQQGQYARFRASPSYLMRVAWPHWLALHDRFRPRPGTSLYELLDNYDHNPRAWAAFLVGLDRLAAVGASANVSVVVFVHTSLEYLSFFHAYLDIYARIGHAAQERGMRVIQSFPSLRGHEEESLWVSDLDPHPNAAAHELMARALLDGLETELLPGVK